MNDDDLAHNHFREVDPAIQNPLPGLRFRGFTTLIR